MDEEVRVDTDQAVDPIGPPVLARPARYGARALALGGLVTGIPLAAGAVGLLITWPWPPVNG